MESVESHDTELNHIFAASLLNLTQLCKAEPAFTPGGVRHLLFTKGHELPGVYRFGRRILFDREEFIEGIKQGHTARISGGSAR